MNESSQQVIAVPSVPSPPRLPDVQALIRRNRHDLAEGSPHFQGAVLLLLADAVGVNVDRLVRRSGLPRDFVARGVRRLVDNGWAAHPASSPRWCPCPPACRHFWLDVDVLLGLAQRRVSETGEPEWARAGEWIKDFEYQGPRSTPLALHNEYRDVLPTGAEAPLAHDSATPLTSAGAGDDEELPGTVRSDRTSAIADTNALPREPAANDAGLLVGDWSSANWLS